jgi:CBS domain-containing protein
VIAGLAASVPTVRPDATLADARDVIGDEPFVLVVNDRGIVLGKVLARSLQPPDVGEQPVDSVMVEGPTTVRPNSSLPDLLGRMEAANTSSVIVSSNQGQLIGVLFTEAARATLDELQAQHDHHHHH